MSSSIHIGILPRASAVCGSTLVFVILICSLLDASYNPTGSKATYASMGNPISLLHDARLPLRAAIEGGDSSSSSSTSLKQLRFAPYKEDTPSAAELEMHLSPVRVDLWVESLCIDSQHYFQQQVHVAFNALPQHVMQLNVVMFGNAVVLKNNTLQCQHGDAECDTNSYDQCAQFLYPDPSQHIPYMACLFDALPMGHRDTAFPQSMGLEPCAHDHHLDFLKLKSCHDNTTLNQQLQFAAAKATPKVVNHVPWIEVNGEYLDANANLLNHVCQVYKSQGGHEAGCNAVLSSESNVDDEDEQQRLASVSAQ